MPIYKGKNSELDQQVTSISKTCIKMTDVVLSKCIKCHDKNPTFKSKLIQIQLTSLLTLVHPGVFMRFLFLLSTQTHIS